MKKIFILILIVSLGFSGCEKDDICDANTPTTPQLVIEFLIDEQNALAIPNKMKIQNADDSKELPFIAGSKIKLPLKTDKDLTRYIFTLNSDVTTIAKNADNLEFNYTRNSVFISRACGYKTSFLIDTNKPILIAETPLENNWIKRIVVTKPNILNEDETHVKIYF